MVMCAGGCGFDSGGGGDDDDDVVDASGAAADATATVDGAPEADAGNPDAMEAPDAGSVDAAPNTAPTISAIEDQATKSAAVGPLAFTVGDAETAAGALTVSAVSSDEDVVPNANLVLGGADADRTLTVTPIASGSAVITVTVDDGTDTADETFTLTVTNQPPSTIGDGYLSIGNSELTVSAASGVLANDSDGDGDDLTATADTLATTLGGSVVLAADGAFVYRPPVGVTGATDSFEYEVSDGFESATGTASITLSSLVWYVDNSVESTGDGRSHAPFQSLVEAQTASGAGDILFVHTGDGTSAHQDAGVTLKNGQRLIGQGVDLTVDGIPLVAAGTPPVLTNSSGNGVTLAATGVVRGLTIRDVQLDGVTGPMVTDVRLEDLTIERTGTQAIDIGHNSPSGTVTVRVRNNVIRGNLSDFSTTTTGIDIDVRGSAGGRLDAEVIDNELRGVYSGIFVATNGTTGTGAGGASSVLISGNTIADVDDDGIQLEPGGTAATDYEVTGNTIDGLDAMAATPARGVDFRVRTTAGGVTTAILENNVVRDMATQGISVVGYNSTSAGTLTIRLTNNTVQDAAGEGLTVAPSGSLIFYATVEDNAMSGNGNPSSFEFFSGTAHAMSLNLFGNADDVGYRLERDTVGVLQLAGELGVGSSFDDDNGNIKANGNVTGVGDPVVTVFTTGATPQQIQIVDPATVPTP